MGSEVIIFPAPLLNQYLGFGQRCEDLVQSGGEKLIRLRIRQITLGCFSVATPTVAFSYYQVVYAVTHEVATVL